MTLYEFMVNAFYLLVGVICLCVALAVINAFIVAAIRAYRKGRKNRNGTNPY